MMRSMIAPDPDNTGTIGKQRHQHSGIRAFGYCFNLHQRHHWQQRRQHRGCSVPELHQPDQRQPFPTVSPASGIMRSAIAYSLTGITIPNGVTSIGENAFC